MSTTYTFTDVKRMTDETPTKTTDINVVAENTDELKEDFGVEHSVTTGAHGAITCTAIDKSGGTGSVGSGTKRTLTPFVYLDDTSSPDTGLVGLQPSVDFGPTADEICYFNFNVPVDCDVAADITLKLGFCMSSANAGTVVMAIAYDVVSASGDVTPAANTGTDTVTIDPSDTAEILEYDTSLAVANAHITALTQLIGVELYRDADHASDTHTGDFRLISLELQYTTSD